MKRADAIHKLSRLEARALSLAARTEEIEKLFHEDWSGDPSWQSLDADLRDEIFRGALEHPPTSPRYDELLAISLAHGHRASTNEYLMHELRSHGFITSAPSLVGGPDPLHPCPCCGRCTLDARGEYDICPVCWWEDDALDEAEQHASGPNGGLTLDAGRRNFIEHGIFDPRRVDLLPRRHTASRYLASRRFLIVEGKVVEVDDSQAAEDGEQSTRAEGQRTSLHEDP